MKAELDTLLIVIRKKPDEEWPSLLDQRALVEDIEREFEVIDTAGPYASGGWNFIMRERDPAAVVHRINELIQEHIGE